MNEQGDTTTTPAVIDEPANTAADSDALPEQAIAIHLGTEGIACFAMQHCDIPVIRRLEVENSSDAALSDLVVEVSADPAFFDDQRYPINELVSEQRVTLINGDLRLSHRYLRNLNEAVRGHVSIRVQQKTEDGNELLAEHIEPFEILSFHSWPGLRILPEMLAAFSLPNDPVIEQILREASDVLQQSTGSGSFDGYQSNNRQRVVAQMMAIYTAIARKDMRYINPPASFTKGQKVRLPAQIFDSQMGTCLDLTLLFSACLEQAGLNAVILLKEGHSWVGAWLVDNHFPADLVDDIVTVRSRIDGGELLSFETTTAVQHGKGFQLALNAGQQHFSAEQEASFDCAIEVSRARRHKITPLPTQQNDLANDWEEVVEPLVIDTSLEALELPPLINDVFVSKQENPDTPEGRLIRWKSKLLDLSLRNKLLNFKPGASIVPLVVPQPHVLEDIIAKGETLAFTPLPEHLQDGSSRQFETYSAQRHADLFEDTAAEAFAAGQLLAGVGDKELDKRLIKLFRDARTAESDGGANTLFITLGALRWQRGDNAERKHLAPLILVPVKLQRLRARGQFHLLPHDDETIVNPTLLQMLKQEFGIGVIDPDNLPMDEHGVDVITIWQLFRHAVQHMQGWEVLTDTHIGLFSFTKFLMWKDLESRTEELKNNQTVRHLIERSGLEQAGNFPSPAKLDGDYNPAQTYCPMLCDSSQLSAIYAAAEDKSFVIEGPPGTGKSQTITNMIAHLAGSGKRVLFLSEKITALDVVKRRLDSIGLGPFLLELHSAKSGKAKFAKSIKKTLEETQSKPAKDWQLRADELKRLRAELNHYIQALHKTYSNGLSAYDGLSVVSLSEHQQAAGFQWADINTHSPDDLEALREAARDLAQLAEAVGEINGHPFELVQHGDWTPGWEASLCQASASTAAAIDQLTEYLPAMTPLVGLPTEAMALNEIEQLDQIANQLLASGPIAIGSREISLGQSRVQRTLERLQSALAAFQATLQQLQPNLDPEKLRRYDLQLTEAWQQAESSWWPLSWFRKRAVRKQLIAFSHNGKRPKAPVLIEMLQPLDNLREQRQAFDALHAEAQTQELLNDNGDNLDSYANEVQATNDWLAAIRKPASQLAGSDLSKLQLVEGHLRQTLNLDSDMLSTSGVIGEQLNRFRQSWANVRSQFSALLTLHGPDFLALPAFAEQSGGYLNAQSQLQRMANSGQQLKDWCGWNRYSQRAEQTGLAPLIQKIASAEISHAQIPDYFEFSYHDWLARKAFDQQPLLSGFLSSVHEQRIADFRKADAAFQQLTEDYLYAELSAKSSCQGEVPKEELTLLNHQAQLQRAHKPVRHMVQQLPETLKRVKPILLMSPLSVAQYLEPTENGGDQFDVLIMDEASQIPVWDAVGAIARAKQVIVVGDTKQLPPTNFFNSAGGDNVDDGGYEDLESILDECMAAGLPTMRLQWHYRSRHESLITFSNRRYYDSELITFPSPVTKDRAVSLRYVNGIYERGGSRTNPKEAAAICDYIAEHYADEQRREQSLGVVAFSQAQEQLIMDLVDVRRQEDRLLDEYCEANKEEPLMIKNLEAVQGDERDVILFSIGYGPDDNGKLTYNMGPLNRDGGHRRLNVAITRAREQVVVFSSIRGDDLSASRVKAKGVNDLKRYLSFAEKGPRALPARTANTSVTKPSVIQQRIAEAIRKEGFEVELSVGVSDFRVDLGVVDQQDPNRFLLGISCDGPNYHNAATARDRDRLREMVLEGLGWKIERIWSTDWWTHPERELQQLMAKVKQLQASAPSSEVTNLPAENTAAEENAGAQN